jgi:hypothetical protein
LGSKLREQKYPCRPVANDMRVKIDAGYVYPHVVIHCGEGEFEDDAFDTLTNPVVIYMKELSDLLNSFNLRCGLSFSADMSGQPMAVIENNWRGGCYDKKKWIGVWNLSGGVPVGCQLCICAIE